MHHISKAESICDTVEELVASSSRPINFIVISIGEFASLRKEHMENAFEVLKKSRPLLKTLSISYSSHEGSFVCLGCGYVGSDFKRIEYSERHGMDPMIICEQCESGKVIIKSGTDVHLDEAGYKV